MSHFFQPTLSHWFGHTTRPVADVYTAPVSVRLSAAVRAKVRAMAKRASAIEVSTPSPSTQTLAQHATYWVTHPQHRRVHCDAGVLWLAFDRDTRDVVLEAGQTHLCQNDARLSIHALQQGVFQIS
jgi:Protein of unknown function (DUF2917)